MSKTALITGGSSDIALAIGKELNKAGYKIILTARNEDKLKKHISEIGGDTTFIVADLVEKEEIVKITDQIEGLDLLVNLAGVWHSGDKVFAGIDYQNFSQDEIDLTIDVGIIAPMLLVHGLVAKMPKGSNIINISGTFESGGKGWLPYYVSKKALEDFTFSLANELRDKEINVNGISPSDTATNPYKQHFPEYIEEAIQPDEIAELLIRIVKSSRTGTIETIKRFGINNNDIKSLEDAIELSNQSYKESNFPVGAVIVEGEQVIAQGKSSKYPYSHAHAESNAIDTAIKNRDKNLEGAILYSSMEPCLMCLSKAYWSGIRRIVFAIKKESLPIDYYESNHSNNELLERFNEKIEFVYVKELEDKAMDIINKYENER